MCGTGSNIVTLILIYFCAVVGSLSQTYNYNEIRETYKDDLVDHLGDGSQITFQTLVDHFKTHSHTYTPVANSLISDCLVDNTSTPVSFNRTCLLQKVILF